MAAPASAAADQFILPADMDDFGLIYLFASEFLFRKVLFKARVDATLNIQ